MNPFNPPNQIVPNLATTSFILLDVDTMECRSTGEIYPCYMIQKIQNGYRIELLDEDSPDGVLTIIMSRNKINRKIYWYFLPEFGYIEQTNVNGPYEDYLQAANAVDAYIAELLDDPELVWNEVIYL